MIAFGAICGLLLWAVIRATVALNLPRMTRVRPGLDALLGLQLRATSSGMGARMKEGWGTPPPRHPLQLLSMGQSGILVARNAPKSPQSSRHTSLCALQPRDAGTGRKPLNRTGVEPLLWS